MVRYAITDGSRFPDAAARREGLLADARRWAVEGVEMVQLREKEAGAGEMLALAEAMLAVFAEAGGRTKLLVNSRCDVAVAAEADGVQLTARPGELTPEQVRRVFAAGVGREPVVSVACHRLDEVARAREAGAEWIVFGPVFEKRVGGEVVVAGVGLEELARVCEVAGGVPVLALGGVTQDNCRLCLEAGAAGIAGIRLFA